MRAVMKGYQLPVDHSSANPPSKHKVIRGGSNAQVLALLGPLCRGEPAAGYRLFEAKIGTDRIDYVFERDGAKVNLHLTERQAGAGPAGAETASFRVVVDGDAPPADLTAVSERVIRELTSRDRGQLWVMAEDAPTR